MKQNNPTFTNNEKKFNSPEFEGFKKSQRLIQLNQIAIQQMKVLENGAQNNLPNE